MSEEQITKSYNRQCHICRRIHSLGSCFYGISNGTASKMPRGFPKGSRGRDPRKSLKESQIFIRSFSKLANSNSLKAYMSHYGFKKIRNKWLRQG